MKKIQNDEEGIRVALAVAQHSLDNGNMPFGCILVGPDGAVLLKAENSVITDKDAIAHCEINLVHKVRGKYDSDMLNRCTVYASTEPCPMCAAALYWAGIGRVVYGLGKEKYHEAAKPGNPDHVFDLSARSVFEKARRKTEVVGPVLEGEALEFYKSIR